MMNERKIRLDLDAIYSINNDTLEIVFSGPSENGSDTIPVNEGMYVTVDSKMHELASVVLVNFKRNVNEKGTMKIPPILCIYNEDDYKPDED